MLKRPYNVLVLDDDPDICEVLQEYLEELYGEQLVVSTCTSPNQALETIKGQEINITLVDITMPEMMGDEFLRKIKKLQTGTEVIILTGDTALSTCATCFYDGATAFLRKPFKIDNLLKVVDMSIMKLDHWAATINEAINCRKK